MPHIERFTLDGVRLPSVSTITGSLSKAGLERWYRKLGFDECDRQSKESREQGTRVAEMFEEYRKSPDKDSYLRKKHSKYLKKVLTEWITWGEGWEGIELVPEAHLVNTVDKYHGSPDLVFREGDQWYIGDDKSKKRFADYGLLMNEHAYATCDSIEIDGKLSPVPWPTPIQDIWFWCYCPSCGKIHPTHHKYDQKIYEDFLVCRKMYNVNRTAEKYFEEHATLLPCTHEGTV